MQLGDRLRSIRQSKSVSLKELERRTGVSQTYWSYLECGHRLPGVKMLEKWAGALNVPLYKLFYEEKGNPNLPNLTTDCDTWFELSTLCKQIVDSLGLVGPVLELAANKSEAEQLMYLRAI
jgi:transcriptional regulator with XRE-family HTH domain